MKITKRQLKRIIREEYSQLIKEEKRNIINEGNSSVDYMIGYEDARDDLPMNPTHSKNGFYQMGYADFMNDIHDNYRQLIKDQQGM